MLLNTTNINITSFQLKEHPYKKQFAHFQYSSKLSDREAKKLGFKTYYKQLNMPLPVDPKFLKFTPIV